MDEFSFDRPEFTATLISIEFGPGGRIQQLWAADPDLPDQDEEFQFVLGPVNLSEEIAEDYYPGTVLIGARTTPEDPWVLSRNSQAETMELNDPGRVGFEYDFGLLPEIRGTGIYYEVAGPLPQVIWELTLTNRGEQTVEIGELAFPLALNNIYEGYDRSDEGIDSMIKDRVYLHKFIGGTASYVFAQRLNADTPGLLIYPGEDTAWEFFNHVPASLNTLYRWEGIPVVYIHSKAVVEREGWRSWFNGHTSLMLDPGDSRKYEMRFVPASRNRFDGVNPTLAVLGRPAIRLLPSAVAPADVGIAVEVSGRTPTQFYSDPEAELETDSDEEGGFCFVKPTAPGALRLSFEDTKGGESSVHLLFTHPIETLIKKRANWIVEHQIHDSRHSNLGHAIVVTDIVTGEHLSEPEDYTTSFAVEASLADALYLAEKNAIYPDKGQIKVLDHYIERFLEDDLQNPGSGALGTAFSDSHSIAVNTGLARVYPLATCLYMSAFRIASAYGSTGREPKEYLKSALKTAYALFSHAGPRNWRGLGVPLMPEMRDLLQAAMDANMMDDAKKLSYLLSNRAMDLSRYRYPIIGNSLWGTSSYEEMFANARNLQDEESQERAQTLAYAGRSLAPSWWWYGGDKRWLDEGEAPHPAMPDKGELCLGPTTAANSLLFFQTLDRDYTQLPDAWMRSAFGGLLGIWALVREDGAASMGFCPDPASKQFGVSALTGDVGLSLYYYLRNVASYVLPTGPSGVTTFGCRFGSEGHNGEELLVQPWDGVGRRIVVRQLGMEVEASFGKIVELRFDIRKRRARVVLQNPADKDLEALITVKGLWGSRVEASGVTLEALDGELNAPIYLPREATAALELKVVG
ncbi:MAG: DUF5695 domain-containing protein [Fimbriimonadales bacterium]